MKAKSRLGYFILSNILLVTITYGVARAAVENIEIDCSGSHCFIISQPNIQSQEDLQQYIDTTLYRLSILDTLVNYKAMITFTRPLGVTELEALSGTGTGGVKYLSSNGDVAYYPYPFQDESPDVQPDSISGFVSAYVFLPQQFLTDLSGSSSVVAVDPGPVELLAQYSDPEIIIATDVYSSGLLFGKRSGEGPSTLLPQHHFLGSSFPNPFNSTCEIRYGLAEKANVNLTIYDLLGREVRVLVNGNQDAGFKSVLWNGLDKQSHSVASGTYLYRLTIGEFSQSKPMTLLK